MGGSTTADKWVDCSSNNPIPDLKAYAAVGHRHLCRKVSEGTGYHWIEGDQVADRAHAAGLTVGHYHWLRPDVSPAAQAAFFIGLVKSHLMPPDWLMTDFERTQDAADPPDAERALQLRTFNNLVRRALPGHPLYVYTGNWYLDGHPQMQAECRRWPVVMSDYSGAAELRNPYDLKYVAWQFTDHATVAGFSRPVDYNRWLLTPQTGDLLMAMTEEQIKDEFAALGKAVANANVRLVDALNGDEKDPGSGLRDLSRKLDTIAGKLDQLIAAVQS